MSVIALVKTARRFEPDTLFRHLAGNGEKIVVASGEFPNLQFGTAYESISGVLVSQSGQGYEIQVYPMSSAADYRLFGKVIDAVVEITGGVFYDAHDDRSPVGKKAADFYDDEWMARQRESSLMVVKRGIACEGEPFIMQGMFAPFCIGPRLLEGMEIDLYGDYNANESDELEHYLCNVQWMLSEKKSTDEHMVIADPDAEDSRDQLSVSLITIKNNKVEKFDYLSYADLLCILDSDRGKPTLLDFREVWKIIPDDVFRFIDEYQFLLEGELTAEAAREMCEKSRHLQQPTLIARPTYPGCGYHEGQNTVILMWNPDISSVTPDDHKGAIPRMLTESFNWSVWEYDKANIGDKFYLVRCGQGRTGIVMSGIFDSNPYESVDWSGRGRQTFYMDMLPNVILDPEQAPMITTEELLQAIPTFNWKGGSSGRLLSQDEAGVLEMMWAKFIETHKNEVDHVTLNMVMKDIPPFPWLENT